jgi:hypothetical protein
MWSNMNTTQHQDLDRSQLFLVRLWAEQGRDDSSDSASPNAEKVWRGRVQHIVSGKAHSFHDWSTLVDLLLAMLPPCKADKQLSGSGKEGNGDEQTGD